MRLSAFVGVAASILGVAIGATTIAAASTLAPQGDDPSAWARIITWIFTQQQLFHGALITAFRALSETGGASAARGLISASFLYGIFHAAGPGHGKAVLATYLLTSKEQVGRGIAMAALAAFCQGLVAIAIVYGLIFIAGWLPRDASVAVTWSERLSFALVLLLGGFLVLRAARSAYVRLRRVDVGSTASLLNDETEHDHAGCGHSHVPSSHRFGAANDLRAMIGVVLSIGLRPCTGAVLVLVFAKVTGLVWAGVGAVLAMSAGTAIAVAALAIMAVKLRSWSSAVVSRSGARAGISTDILLLVGGLILIGIGVSLLIGSFSNLHPLGLK